MKGGEAGAQHLAIAWRAEAQIHELVVRKVCDGLRPTVGHRESA
jgi:hypothetical protein